MGSGVSKNCRKENKSSSDIDNSRHDQSSDKSKTDLDPAQHESEHPRNIAVVNPQPRPRGSTNTEPGSTHDVHDVVCDVQSHDSDAGSIIEKELQDELEKQCQPKPVEANIATESNRTTDLTETEKAQLQSPSIFNENFNKLVSEYSVVSASANNNMSTDRISKQGSLRTDSMQPKDIMISYSHKDDEMMKKCRGESVITTD